MSSPFEDKLPGIFFPRNNLSFPGTNRYRPAGYPWKHQHIYLLFSHNLDKYFYLPTFVPLFSFKKKRKKKAVYL